MSCAASATVPAGCAPDDTLATPRGEDRLHLLEPDSLAMVAAALPVSADVCSFPLLFGGAESSRVMQPRSTTTSSGYSS